MNQSPPASTDAASPRNNVPGAWYDLSGRLAAARAVARQIINCMPAGQRALPVMPELDEICNLSCAVTDLLDLAIRDHEELESQLLKGA